MSFLIQFKNDRLTEIWQAVRCLILWSYLLLPCINLLNHSWLKLSIFEEYGAFNPSNGLRWIDSFITYAVEDRRNNLHFYVHNNYVTQSNESEFNWQLMKVTACLFPFMCILVHLSTTCMFKVSYCDRSLSVVRPSSTISSNDISS